MIMRIQLAAVVLLAGCLSGGSQPSSGSGEGLRPAGVIPLPDVAGRIDHFALDPSSGRLFVAALGNNTVEVIDLKAGKVTGRLPGLATPQGVAVAPEFNRLAVANDKDGSVRLYELDSLKPAGQVDLKDDADNVRYDARAKRFWVGYGAGGLAALDPQTGQVLAEVKLDGHPESFQLESQGARIFVNVPRAGQVAVVDRAKAAVIARWPLKDAGANFPMALDEANHRLFVGCRKPAALLVFDTESGQEVARVGIVGDTDDLFYDPAARRLYISGGEGGVSIVQQADANRYEVIGQVPTAPGARTAFFDPGTSTLYVAVPRRGSQPAEIRVLKAAAR